MTRIRIRALAAPVLLALAVTACGSSSGGTAAPAASGSAAAAGGGAAAAADAALAKIQEQVLSKGPNGEDPSPASSADITQADIDAVKAMHAKAAIVMHYGGNDWSVAQIDGLKAEFAKVGIEVVATTDANFKPDKQVSDIQTVLAKKPNVIVSIPTDPVATASAYKAAAAAGVKLVFMDNVPKGFTAGKDYASVVSADNYGNGVTSAHLMAKALNGKGKIGLIFHEADFFVTKQRYEGFKKTIADNYKDIQVVEEKGIAGPDFAGDAQAAANAMLSKHADLDGIWAVWDVPAEGVMAAARASGRNDLKIATEDLGKNVAIALAKGELIVGLGAQRPYDQGVTEVHLAVKALLGQKTPAYVALPSLPVQHSNVLDAWKQVYHQDAPADLKNSFK
ncbi:MAG: monosaccharide transporter substrate-binding protein family [Frankiales bacterium]|jgi:ribose transport system substrate-binding protein|nr:monosaccharide transporter substrate-binding protein family [Frankiales bacterium]